MRHSLALAEALPPEGEGQRFNCWRDASVRCISDHTVCVCGQVMEQVAFADVLLLNKADEVCSCCRRRGCNSARATATAR